MKIIIVLFLVVSSSVSFSQTILHNSIEEYMNSIRDGGPLPDGIPPIENPIYVSLSEFQLDLNDEDPVFLVETENDVFAYPQKIMVWHEIVNDNLFGKNVSLTYCPLTGSAIGYFSNSETDSFGTSGKLVNSNLIMYDRQSKSYWPQILGSAISGEKTGETLSTFPVIWTTWERLKEVYPDAKILSLNTGFSRSYGYDPYGDYSFDTSYYRYGEPKFPVMNRSELFNQKDIVIGIKSNGKAFNILKETVREKKIINTFLDNIPVIIFYDEKLDTVRIYERYFDNTVLIFELIDGKVIDRINNIEINNKGEILSQNYKDKLTWVDSFDVMWFAWYAYLPETEIIY